MPQDMQQGLPRQRPPVDLPHQRPPADAVRRREAPMPPAGRPSEIQDRRGPSRRPVELRSSDRTIPDRGADVRPADGQSFLAHPPVVRPANTTKRAQVRSILEQLIDDELHPGDAIPSERALVVRLGVSRVTVRQAIADLVDASVLERVHGKGTYVTGPQVDSRLHLTSFSREMRARGLVPATVVLSAAEAPADDDVAYALRIRPGRKVIRVERLRTADGTPMAYEVGYYPSALFPGLLDRELGSLYDVFASEYGVVVTSGEQTVRAESADAQQARILGIAKRAPLLVQERVTSSADRVIELSTSWYRADRYRIHMAITPRGPREG